MAPTLREDVVYYVAASLSDNARMRAAVRKFWMKDWLTEGRDIEAKKGMPIYNWIWDYAYDVVQ